MNAPDLIAEGERLCRPCLYLTSDRDSGPLTGIWSGRGIVPPPLGPFQHWLSIDCDWFAKQGLALQGVISVYTNDDDVSGGVVETEPKASLTDLTAELDLLHNKDDRREQVHLDGRSAFVDSVALYAREARSFPPIEAVFVHGSSRVKEWLSSQGLPNQEQWDPYFQARKAAEPYELEWQKRCPLYSSQEEIAAQLGGWHLAWPDGDWFDLLEHRLLMWTFWDSEPWLEVWLQGPASFRVLRRIT